MAPEKLITDNRKARHEYHLLERHEAGLVLTGSEVKSLREGRASLQNAYADVRDGEVWLVNATIQPYEAGPLANHEPERDRKLLAHRNEIEKLVGRVHERGLTLVPTRIYFREGRAKAEIALARGKDQFDKREAIKERESKRDMQRALREANR